MFRFIIKKLASALQNHSSKSSNPNFHRLLNRVTAFADVELPVKVLQVWFDGCCWNVQFVEALAAPIRFNCKLAAALDEHDQRVVSKWQIFKIWLSRRLIPHMTGRAFSVVSKRWTATLKCKPSRMSNAVSSDLLRIAPGRANIPLFHHSLWLPNVDGHKKYYISKKL